MGRMAAAVTGLLLAALAAASPLRAAPPEGGLILAIGGEPETGFDPLTGQGAPGAPLFHSTLIRQDDDLRPLPDLALDWQLSEDRLTWELTLRADARFADGSPLTARDVVFTLQKGKELGTLADLSVMASAEALSEDRLRVTLLRPRITFFDVFLTLGIVPEAAWGPGYARAPLGSGPYVLRDWQEGTQLIAERNPHYYGAQPDFERLTFLFTGPDTALAAAAAGQAHVVHLPPQLAETVPAGFRLQRVPSVDNRGISLPFPPPREEDGRRIGHAVTSDPAIRAALSLGLDRALLAEVALLGFGRPASGPADGLPWGGSEVAETDPARAAALLEAAGWVAGPDGVRVKGGQRAEFRLNYPASDPLRQALAEVTAELLRPLGIAAEPKGSGWSVLRQVMHSEPVVFGFGSHSPAEIYSLYSGTLAGVEYQNPGFYSNPRVEALFEAAQGAASPEASWPIWSEAAAIYGPAGENAWIWLVNLEHLYLVDQCLETGRNRVEPHLHGWPLLANLADWRWTCE